MQSAPHFRPYRALALAAALVLGLTPPALDAQQGIISGTAEDARSGQPLASVQISVGALDIGVLSNAGGTYQLTDVPAGTHTVTAQRLGYETVEETVNVGAGQTVVLDFALTQAALQLDAVVVTGTAGGTQRRAIGNVVERMDAVAVQEITPVTNVEQLLGTRVPGLAMQAAGGTIGGGQSQIRIRGSASVGLPNDPLVYIDGVRMNIDRTEGRRQTTGRLNDINPEDIESIEVIKGPAAATLYGTEASNGVIQIITKRGAEGDVQIDASVGLGANWLMDPPSKVFTNYAMIDGQLRQMNIIEAEEERFGEPMFRYGAVQEYSLAARGGTDLFRYFVSFNRNGQDGWIDWNWDLRQTGRMNLDLTINDRLSIAVNGSMMSGLTRLAGDFWVQTMRGSPRTAEDYGGNFSPLRGFGTRTPEVMRDGQHWMFDTERKNASVNVQFAPWPWFQNRLVAGIDLTDQIENNTIFRESNAPRGLWRTAGLGVRDVNSLETQLKTLDYSGTVSYDLTPEIGTATSFGFQFYEKKLWDVRAQGDEFATEALSTVGAAARLTAFEDQIENVTVGFYVQEQLSWQDRLFLTAAVRIDENSAFGTDFGSQTYPKVSGTWVLSEESFWSFGFLDPLRIRGAWGAAGRQPDTFAAQRIYRPVTGPGLQPILTANNFGNAELGPERGQEFEIGFDAGLLDERVQIAFTQYWKSTKDAIVNAPVRPSYGFPGEQFINAGQIDNWGTEVTLDLQVLQNDPVRWDVGVAFALNDNEIVSLGDDIEDLAIRRGRRHTVGFPLAGFHDFRVVSADFVSGTSGPINTDTFMCDGGISSGGGYVTGGPAVPCGDAPRVFWGPTHHTWTVNANSTFTILEDWRVFAAVQGQGGGYVHADQAPAKHTSWRNSYASNVQTDPIFMGTLAKSRNPTGLIANGYLNFEELGVQYQIPATLVERMGADRASIAFSVRNLGFIWREAWETEIGGVRIPDIRQGLGNQEFIGQQDSQAPLSSSGLVRLRVSF
ncbi:MAG: TonB-dependent receptor [Gammaproteobacteria bacterium]|nr:TonB-dependent receptor [Gammaproteobacteria bacterium]